MMGAGFNVFAVWDYVITNTHFGVIELNPKLVAFTLAGTRPGAVKEVEDAIEYLCRVDAESRSKAEAGRKMVKEGEYQYRVVNWDHYQGLRDAAAQREYNRQAKRRERAKKKGPPLPGENAAIAAEERGDQKGADAIITESLPVPRGNQLKASPAGTPHLPPCNPEPGRPDPDPQRSASQRLPEPDPESQRSTPLEEELTYPDGEPLD